MAPSQPPAAPESEEISDEASEEDAFENQTVTEWKLTIEEVADQELTIKEATTNQTDLTTQVNIRPGRVSTSEEDIQESKDFEILELVGQGGMAQVFKCPPDIHG